ncbi:hypothetical protein CEP50_17555 [Actinopolyspora mortivallis]|uniref:Uncharacterized protein n=1 Tax=Actinopolyspora mortivallis TaxID=33906 RepID=A0A2T0GSH8_ACTMO|nr:hypothetical protein CEP50_17555 [Actinopolyspora mortivallis]
MVLFCVFLSFSVGGGVVFFVPPLGAVAVIVLGVLVRRVRGVEVDRTRDLRGGWGPNMCYYGLFLVLTGVGAYLEFGAQWRWSMAVAGALLLVPTIMIGRHNDLAKRRERGARA